MLLLSFLVILIIFYVLFDVNYLARTYSVVLSGRIYQRQNALNEATTIYGFGTFQDSDVLFKSIRLSRIVRELDFARYHFYDRTGIYARSKILQIRSLQGSTLTLSFDNIPIFVPYKINTKLIFWDDRSLFFEHRLQTLLDGKVRAFIVSRQYALGPTDGTVAALLHGLPGADVQKCPEYLQHWLQSMQASSVKLKRESRSIAESNNYE